MLDNLIEDQYSDALDGLVREVPFNRWAEYCLPPYNLQPYNTQRAEAEALVGALQDLFDKALSRVTHVEVLTAIRAVQG